MNEENKQLLIILLIVLISFIGASIAYPIIPPLFLHPTDNTLIPLEWSVATKRLFLGFALATFPLGQFIGSPILGRSADLYGHKKILTLSLIGCILGYLLTALSLHINSLVLLLFSRFLTGFMEGSFAISKALASELTTISKYVSFGRINSMAAIGYIVGPIFGGIFSDFHIISWFSYSLPFIIAAIVSLITLLLAYWKLKEQKKDQEYLEQSLSLWSQINIIRQIKLLLTNYPELKYLLMISTFFTFAVDIFYEFGPVYLAGKWFMSPAKIALYNAGLSFTLALGATWIPRHLSKHYPISKIILFATITTALIFGLMILFQYQVPMFLFFALAGFSITTVTTTLTIYISNTAHPTIQGEVMGTQISLRNLGDALICFIGGFLIVISIISPIILSTIVAFISSILCVVYLKSTPDKSK